MFWLNKNLCKKFARPQEKLYLCTPIKKHIEKGYEETIIVVSINDAAIGSQCP